MRSPSSFTNSVAVLRTARMDGHAVRLHSLRGHALYAAPIRVGLGALWLAVAHLAGVTTASTLLACGGGVFVIAFVAFNDPRMGFASGAEVAPAPPGATYATPVEQALAAMMPSTLGLTVLAAVAVTWEPMLTALLGAISAGLGVAGLLRAFRVDPSLWWDRAGGVYRRTA